MLKTKQLAICWHLNSTKHQLFLPPPTFCFCLFLFFSFGSFLFFVHLTCDERLAAWLLLLATELAPPGATPGNEPGTNAWCPKPAPDASRKKERKNKKKRKREQNISKEKIFDVNDLRTTTVNSSLPLFVCLFFFPYKNNYYIILFFLSPPPPSLPIGLAWKRGAQRRQVVGRRQHSGRNSLQARQGRKNKRKSEVSE